MKILDKLSLVPDPWNRIFLLVWIVAAVAVTAVLGWRNGATTIWPAGIALFISLLGVLLVRPRHFTQKKVIDNPIVARTDAAQKPEPSKKAWIPISLMPLLLAAPFIFTAVVIGAPSSSGFPAVLTVLLGTVAVIMRNLENRLRWDSAEEDPGSQHYYARTLSWVSIILFFFGVVTLWPWLGKLYSDVYFWILIFGVLVPQLYFWGRVRQPHAEHPMLALIRFNRLLPYIGIILLIAIVLG